MSVRVNFRVWSLGLAALLSWSECGKSQTGIFFDGLNHRLGINNNAPQQPLDVTGNGAFSGTVTASGFNLPVTGGTVALQSVSLTIANAQVKTLHTVGVTLVAAQGPGTLLVPVSLTLENVFLTAAYTGGGNIGLAYTSPSGLGASSTEAATFLTTPIANQLASVGLGNSISYLASGSLNQPLVLFCTGADFAGGSGSLIVHLTYLVHTGFL
jgi:hypothetical protein